MKIYGQSIPERKDDKHKSPKAGNRPVEPKYRTLSGELEKGKLEGKVEAKLCWVLKVMVRKEWMKPTFCLMNAYVRPMGF